MAVADINGEGAQAVADGIGAAAIAVTWGVSKRVDIDATADVAIDAFGNVDIVVNNAGWSRGINRYSTSTKSPYRRFIKKPLHGFWFLASGSQK